MGREVEREGKEGCAGESSGEVVEVETGWRHILFKEEVAFGEIGFDTMTLRVWGVLNKYCNIYMCACVCVFEMM